VDEEQSAESRSEEEQDQPQDTDSQEESDKQESGGADSAEQEEQSEDSDDGDKTEVEQEEEKLQQQVKELEENPPDKLEDWPEDQAKYETFGGAEGTHGYHEGPEQKLGPSSLRHHEDGSVEIEGETVDDPKQYKGEPLKGGPTDPDTPGTRGDKAKPEDRSDVSKEAAGDAEADDSSDEESSDQESEN
jgi:hypothetical protein